MKLKASSRQNAQSLGMPLVGMIDVVFLLLIYFLVMSAWQQPEKQLTAVIQSAAIQTEAVTDLEPSVIKMNSREGSVVFQYGTRNTKELFTLKEWIQKTQFKDNGIQVHVGPDIEFELVTQVISACRAIGFQKVIYVPITD